MIRTDYASPQKYPECMTSVLYLDSVTSIPISITKYGWRGQERYRTARELRESNLVESFLFSELNLSASLTDADFESDNKSK